jgi:hypothetical protein
VTFTTDTTGSVTVRTITVTAATVTKSYDGTTSSMGMPTITGDLGTGDTAAFTETFDSRNVGQGKTLTATGSANDGNGGNNYTLSFAINTNGQITPRAITVAAAASSKGYDRTTSSTAVPTISSGSLATGDIAAFTETFNTKNVGTGELLIPTGSVNDGNSGANYAVTFTTNATGSVTARAITVAAATGIKVYDGTTSSTATPTIGGGNLAPGDIAAFGESFDTRNAGTGKTLIPAGSVNDGNGGENYAVTLVANTTGSITARAITVAALASTKGYDGTTSSTATPTVGGGSLATGDTAAFAETFISKNAGTGKTLTPAGSVNDGNGGNNYTVIFTTSTGGSITARAITVTAATGTKGYDGTTSSTAVPAITGSGLVSGDTAAFGETFVSKDAGAETLVPAGSVNDGNGGDNYVVTGVDNTVGSITGRAITVTAATGSKVYDGTTFSTAVPTITGGSLASGDTAAFTETFNTKNVGTGETLTVAGLINDGNGGANYAVNVVNNATGSITARAITVAAATGTKVYDGTTSSTAVPTISGGSLATGDTAAFTETFNTKNVGAGKTLAAGRVGQRRQRRQQLRGDPQPERQRRYQPPADHRHGGRRDQGLRRHDRLDGPAGDHRRQPGRRRHGGLYRDLQYEERGCGQDAHGRRLGQRRQRRRRLRGNRRGQRRRLDHGAGDQRHGGFPNEGLRRNDVGDVHAGGHRRQPGRGRRGGLQRVLFQRIDGHGLDAHAGRVGQRRQRRKQLCGDL